MMHEGEAIPAQPCPTPAFVGRDAPGILLPPPLIPAAMLAVGLALQHVAPLHGTAGIPLGWRVVAGTILILGGTFVVNSGRLALKRRGTNVNPYMPSLTVATSGVYARTRNPIYVGGIIALTGIALAFALDWVLLLTLPGILLLHYGVVLREEEYLGHKFGETYRAYKTAVRRYV